MPVAGCRPAALMTSALQCAAPTGPFAGPARQPRKKDKFVPTHAIPEHAAVQMPPRTRRLPERYDLGSKLGSGAYGTVYEAYDREGGRMVAIKRIPHIFGDAVVAKRVLREVTILARLASPHVVRLHDIVVPHGDLANFKEVFLVMEIGDTDLQALMQTDISFTHSHVKWIFRNLLRGLRYLHAANVYHRDLKPANVLVNADCGVKICDFGLARAVGKRRRPFTPIGSLPPLRQGSLCEGGDAVSPTSSKVSGPASPIKRSMTKHVATRHYRAPEIILLLDGYTEAIDVWSAGCIYAEMTQLLAGVEPECRGPLFPGTTCFPLSPDASHPWDGIFHSRGSMDQLNMIFDVLGTPTEKEVRQLDREDAQNYIRCFAPRRGEGLQRRLPYADPDSVDLLAQMLRFGQAERVSAETTLGHRLFVGVGGVKVDAVSSKLVEFSDDAEQHLAEQDLREHLVREIMSFTISTARERRGGA